MWYVKYKRRKHELYFQHTNINTKIYSCTKNISIIIQKHIQRLFIEAIRHWLAWGRFEIGFLLKWLSDTWKLHIVYKFFFSFFYGKKVCTIETYFPVLVKLVKIHSNMTQVHQTLQSNVLTFSIRLQKHDRFSINHYCELPNTRHKTGLHFIVSSSKNVLV